ncbi:MAG: galactose mutarotase [Acidimicrobiaceae bacterium]|nr:galactose mutarotase [Acidimicrobiaceae bacterium]MYD07727.1 galactose mutarotase [Acidimicrobiaceae bacterium]MYI57147.1 galactose mutarotase [Acidimicrobiaceae bacterium]
MPVEIETYGNASSGETHTVTLTCGALKAVFCDFGARLLELWVPDRHGDLADVVLANGNIAALEASNAYFGATCGRFANRIKGGRFTLDGRRYQVGLNDGANHLHGGPDGFDKRVWRIDETDNDETNNDETRNTVRFSTVSPDGDQGYPGEVTTNVEYTLGPDSLEIAMTAETTAPTVVNLVNHAYWNLAGHDSGDVLDQQVQIEADFYTPADADLIVTGEVRAVADSPYDFRVPRRIGDAIGALDQTAGSESAGSGFDRNWVLRGEGETMRHAATAFDHVSGRRLDVSTTAPGVHFYTAGGLSDSEVGKGDVAYCRFAGYCFETQHFPDSPNQPLFPSARLDPGAVYDHRVKFEFSIG